MANCSGVGFCFAHIQSGDPFMVPVLPEQKLLLPWLLLCLHLAADGQFLDVLGWSGTIRNQ